MPSIRIPSIFTQRPPASLAPKNPTPIQPPRTLPPDSSLKSLAPQAQDSFPSLRQIVTGLICFIYQTIRSFFSQIKQIFTEEKKEKPRSSPPLSSPPTLRQEETKLPLTISVRDQKKIHSLIKELATNHLGFLFHHRARLKETGSQLKDIHPYLFLATIFSEPASCHYMQKIHQESTSLFRSRIWNDFVNDLSDTLANCTDLEIYRISFAEILNVDSVQIKFYETEKKWKELITYLVIEKSKL